MEINYIICKECSDSLFSFHRHDYKSCSCGKSFIDGGVDYTRYNGELKTDNIKDLMYLISLKFTWGQNYDENNVRLPETKYVLLKDLTTSHISGILRYFNERLRPEQVIPKDWIAINLIFLYELENRLKWKQ